jgi:hypothetical protein
VYTSFLASSNQPQTGLEIPTHGKDIEIVSRDSKRTTGRGGSEREARRDKQIHMASVGTTGIPDPDAEGAYTYHQKQSALVSRKMLALAKTSTTQHHRQMQGC